VLWRLRKEDCEFKASLGYTARKKRKKCRLSPTYNDLTYNFSTLYAFSRNHISNSDL
jgi:hypothetical protein